MVVLQLSPDDLEQIRFAFNPLIELSLSYRVLHKPEFHAFHAPWVAAAQRTLQGVELPYMNAAILPRRYIVDFLTPTPTTMQFDFEEELERLRQTPDEVVRQNIRHALEYSPATAIHQRYLADPQESLLRLIEELRFYWDKVLACHWSRMSTVLQNEVLYRAQQLALFGVSDMFSDLEPSHLHYEQQKILLTKSHKHHPEAQPLNGAGLQLVPGIFSVCDVMWQVEPPYKPMIIYGARGSGLWYRSEAAEPEEALQLIVGESRARVLQSLIEPGHTTDLAERLDVTAGAISQQLSRLAQAGLVESHRSGSRVYYRLSRRGEKLIELFNETP